LPPRGAFPPAARPLGAGGGGLVPQGGPGGPDRRPSGRVAAGSPAVAWNGPFFRCSPEPEGHLYEGEPYEANLRRFYNQRLDAQELPNIERYIPAGVERHRAQTRPYSFDHRGLRVHVSSLPIEGVGRVRVWRAEALPVQSAQATLATPAEADIHEPGYLRSPLFESSELFDRIPDAPMKQMFAQLGQSYRQAADRMATHVDYINRHCYGA